LGREERGFSSVAVVGGNGVIMFLEEFGSGMCASFEFLAEILCFFFWGGGVRLWGRGADMRLFLTSLLLVIDQDANSMCCAVG